MFNGERYEDGILWNDNEQMLPDNFASATGQLISLEGRINNQTELKKRYEETIQNDLNKRFIRKLDYDEIKKTSDFCKCFPPHHPVVNPHKPENARRVCSAAVKYKGLSLNNKLMSGPDLLRNLLGINFRFREKEYASKADIESMFIHVAVPKNECNFLRFLWRSDPNSKIETYEYKRHLFGAKGSPTCVNYALQRTGTDQKDEIPGIDKILLRSFHMVDFDRSESDKDVTVKLFSDLQSCLKTRGFELKKWITNSEELRKVIRKALRSTALSKTFEIEPLNSSILGLKWNVEGDTLEVSRGPQKILPEIVTQRAVLSHVSSVFDPLGLFTSFTMRMRILHKNIWKCNGQEWDKKLSEEETTVFEDWAEELQQVRNFALQRKDGITRRGRYQLHVFSDASLDSMCIVSYIRDDCDEESHVNFIMGKCRIAPMRQLSIPRLELHAEMYATRLRKHIVDEHDLVFS